ncbi:MAG: hypothetical protein V8Q05_13005 [Lachnospiraceae bacterium]
MEEKCMGLKNEVALQEKQTGDVDRQLDETTRELHPGEGEADGCDPYVRRSDFRI